MKTLVLLAVLFLPAQPKTIEQHYGDLYFGYAVEESIQLEQPFTSIPKDILVMFEALGDNQWKKRDKASQTLYDYMLDNPGAQHWLFWGRHSIDPEIGLRCNNILRALYKCYNCGGKGYNGTSPTIVWECHWCKGSGTAWWLTAWD